MDQALHLAWSWPVGDAAIFCVGDWRCCCQSICRRGELLLAECLADISSQPNELWYWHSMPSSGPATMGGYLRYICTGIYRYEIRRGLCTASGPLRSSTCHPGAQRAVFCWYSALLALLVRSVMADCTASASRVVLLPGPPVMHVNMT